MDKETKRKLIILLFFDMVIFFAIWIGISSLSGSAWISAVGLVAAFLFVMLFHIKVCTVWLKDYIAEFNVRLDEENEIIQED